MSAAEETVTIRAGGLELAQWESATIDYGLESAARSFSLSTTSVRTASGAARPPIRTGQSCDILIGQGASRDLVLRGAVDSIAPSYDKDTQSFGVVGRSLTRNVVDCTSTAPRRQSGRTIPQIARALCEPCGVEVVIDAPPGHAALSTPIERFVVEPDEKIFDAIARLVEPAAMVISDDERGRLRLIAAAPGTFPTQLGAHVTRGANVLAADGEFDCSELFGEYRIKGQRVGSDNDFGAVVAGIGALARDPDVEDRRVLAIVSDDTLTTAQAQDRAAWQVANRLGRSALCRYKVRGWRDDSGTLWTPGTLVPVSDDYMQVAADLLVVNVQLTVDAQGGHVAGLTLAPPAGYYAKLPKDPRKGLGAWGR